MSTGTGPESTWRDIVSVALLGTDRRDPPDLEAGPLGDLVADAQCADQARRLMVTVAALAAARRAGFEPLAPAPPVAPPPPDERPWLTPHAADQWRRIVADWPVLEDEFLLRVVAVGRRLSPDVLASALDKYRRDPVRRARAARAGGPIAAWLDDLVPSIAPSGNRRPVAAADVESLPELPIPPDLAELLPLDAHTFTRRLIGRFDEFTTAHRPVLINLLARCRPEVLDHAAEALAALGTGLAITLADLARTRSAALSSLTPG